MHSNFRHSKSLKQTLSNWYVPTEKKFILYIYAPWYTIFDNKQYLPKTSQNGRQQQNFILYIYATGVLSMIVNNIYIPESCMQSKCKVMISLYNKPRFFNYIKREVFISKRSFIHPKYRRIYIILDPRIRSRIHISQICQIRIRKFKTGKKIPERLPLIMDNYLLLKN